MDSTLDAERHCNELILILCYYKIAIVYALIAVGYTVIAVYLLNIRFLSLCIEYLLSSLEKDSPAINGKPTFNSFQ